MTKFFKHIGLFLLVTFVITESLSRLCIDGYYFKAIDTHQITSKPQQPDYLFIGSSRVAAAISPTIITQTRPNSLAINAGRGYTTGGIHYQAIKQHLKLNKHYLKNTKVFLELPGYSVYDTNFNTSKFRFFENKGEESMSHLILPYIDHRSLIELLKESTNSKSAKFNLVMQYCFSSYRTLPFIKEQINRRLQKWLTKPKKETLTATGGIKNNAHKVAKQKALRIANKQLKDSLQGSILSHKKLDKSMLFELNKLITSHGGQLYLFKMPLHSIQNKINLTNRNKKNAIIFNHWLKTNKIPLINPNHFKFSDIDFPDMWHLSMSKRTEFTAQILEELNTL